ncbi:MAG TPA: hypothetical protein VFN77_08685 [Acetobacteraceae bacterium]|nr:hypothetical protein [Acetobacteraceae bacterium]
MAKPARLRGPVLLVALSLGLSGPALAGSTAGSDHRTALAALHDIKGAISTIIAAENDTGTGPARYQKAAQRAINAIVGQGDDAYMAAAGTPGDEAGAMGNIDHLLDRKASPPWVPVLHGVQANLQAAVARLQDARHAKSLMRYQIAISQSLISLEVAEGRRSDYDVLGGLRGAIANTALAVPAGARVVDACAAPDVAPAYGIHGGYLAFRTVRISNGGTWKIPDLDGTTISPHDGFLVFSMPAAAKVRRMCGTAASLGH